jgi:hypothetical protein
MGRRRTLNRESRESKTDNDGLAEDALSTDDMLDAISLYWYTNSAASSGRIYWENKSASLVLNQA